MSDFLISTTEGDKTPVEFLEDLMERIWPYAADWVELSLIDDSNATLSVAYVIQPFGIEKIINYAFSLTPTSLLMGYLGTEPLDGEVDIKELAKTIDSAIYEDFRSEV